VPFRDVLTAYGNRRVLELLARSIARNSLPPSLILAGPAAAGTGPAALAIAQALNCSAVARVAAAKLQNVDDVDDVENAPTAAALAADACGRCANCTRIARGVHPDVLAISPSENGSIRIDVVREAIERTGYKPFEGRRRVVIIDQADALLAAAQNALLKTLEEPPGSSVFVLVTERPDMLLPTVRSRCIRLAFTHASPQPIDAEARDVARRVLGHVAGGTDARRLDAAKELLANTGGPAAADREQVAAHLNAMASLLRDIAAIEARVDTAVLGNADLRPALEGLAKAFSRDRTVTAFSAIDTALDAIDRNVGIKVVADWLVLQL
jgi:DNA polymerase-3 subunit delta'